MDKSLTKYERHITYIKALEIFRQYKIANIGLCYCLNEARRILIKQEKLIPNVIISSIYCDDFSQSYPEVYKHRPIPSLGWSFWFSFTNYGKRKRINILKEAIKLTV